MKQTEKFNEIKDLSNDADLQWLNGIPVCSYKGKTRQIEGNYLTETE